MPTVAEEMFQQLCKEAGMDDATTTALVTAAKNSPKVTELVRRGTDDFQAMQGRVTAAQRREQELNQWYTTTNAEYNRVTQELAQYQANPYNPPQFDVKYLTKDDLTATVNDLQSRFASVIKDVGEIAADHVARFGSKPDMNEIERIATEQGLKPRQAYEQYIKPRVDEQQKQDLEKRIKEAREEGAKEAMSRHQLPIDPVPTQQSMLHHRPAADSVPKDIDADLLAAWNGVGQK